jgi:hypothetical protein
MRFEWAWDDTTRICLPHKTLLKRIIKLLPNLLEMNFEERTQVVAALFGLEPDLRALVTSVATYRFVECEINSDLVGALGKIPSLRRIEVASTKWEEEEDEQAEEEEEYACKASQVVEVAIVSRNYSRNTLIWFPSRLIRFFPNARFVLVDVDISSWTCMLSAIQLVEKLPPDFPSLKIRNRVYGNEYQTPRIDELLPRFSHLQHLHLDPALYAFHNLCDILPSVKSLVSLSLAFSNNLYHPSNLVEAIKQLPNLRIASFEYYGIKEGAPFDIESVAAQAEETDFDVDYDDALSGLNSGEELSEMEGWSLPFGWDSSKTILQVAEMEQKIEELGIVVNSNLEVVRRAFHRQLVEFFNRAIGALYFYHISDDLEYALHLAQLHNLTLPPLEIDLKDDNLLTRDKLEWFKVDMSGSMEDSGKGCCALNLRYRRAV